MEKTRMKVIAVSRAGEKTWGSMEMRHFVRKKVVPSRQKYNKKIFYEHFAVDWRNPLFPRIPFGFFGAFCLLFDPPTCHTPTTPAPRPSYSTFTQFNLISVKSFYRCLFDGNLISIHNLFTINLSVSFFYSTIKAYFYLDSDEINENINI